MWRKNLIISLVVAMALPTGKAGAALTGLQDEAQPQVSTGDKGVTASALAVPADVKWAHRLATVLAALGTIAGVVQLGYIWKYWGEVGKEFTKPRWYCKKIEIFKGLQWSQPISPDLTAAQKAAMSGILSLEDFLKERHPKFFQQMIAGLINIKDSGIKETNLSCFKAHCPGLLGIIDIYRLSEGDIYKNGGYFVTDYDHRWTPDINDLRLAGWLGAIATPLFALATGWLYRHPPVLKPEAASQKTRAAALATGVIGIPVAVTALWIGMRDVFNTEGPKGLNIQIAAFGGMLLCKAYATLRSWYINHKAAAALAHKANTGAVAVDQAKQLKLA